MQVPNLVIDFLRHGLSIVLAVAAIAYAYRLLRAGATLPGTLLLAGAASLLFGQAFQLVAPPTRQAWAEVVGCCHRFDGVVPLAAFYSSQLAAIVSSACWLLACVVLLRRRAG